MGFRKGEIQSRWPRSRDGYGLGRGYVAGGARGHLNLLPGHNREAIVSRRVGGGRSPTACILYRCTGETVAAVGTCHITGQRPERKRDQGHVLGSRSRIRYGHEIEG